MSLIFKQVLLFRKALFHIICYFHNKHSKWIFTYYYNTSVVYSSKTQIFAVINLWIYLGQKSRKKHPLAQHLHWTILWKGMSEVQMDQSGNYCMAHLRGQGYTVIWEGMWSVLTVNSQTWEEQMQIEKQPRILLFDSHQE